MNRLIAAQIALEEKRQAINTLLDTPAEERAATWDADLETAKNAVKSASSEAIAAGLAEPDVPEHQGDSKEGRELRSMLDKASMGRFIANIVSGTPLDGAEAELRAHFKGDADTIPLALLETRAAATFTGDEPASTEPVIPEVFPMSVAAWAGVAMESVPAGEAQYPVLSTGATVHTPAEGADAAETTGALTITSLTPKRLPSWIQLPN